MATSNVVRDVSGLIGKTSSILTKDNGKTWTLTVGDRVITGEGVSNMLAKIDEQRQMAEPSTAEHARRASEAQGDTFLSGRGRKTRKSRRHLRKTRRSRK